MGGPAGRNRGSCDLNDVINMGSVAAMHVIS